MIEDTAPGALDNAHRRRVRWDPTINLGHVLTFLGFIATGAIGYADLRQTNAVQDTRIGSMEANIVADKARLQQELRDMRADLKDDLKDIRRAVDDAARRTSERRP